MTGSWPPANFLPPKATVSFSCSTSCFQISLPIKAEWDLPGMGEDGGRVQKWAHILGEPVLTHPWPLSQHNRFHPVAAIAATCMCLFSLFQVINFNRCYSFNNSIWENKIITEVNGYIHHRSNFDFRNVKCEIGMFLNQGSMVKSNGVAFRK